MLIKCQKRKEQSMLGVKNKMESDNYNSENKSILQWVDELISMKKIGDFPEHYVTDRVMFDGLGDIADKYEKTCKTNDSKEASHIAECMRHYGLELGLIEEEK